MLQILIWPTGSQLSPMMSLLQTCACNLVLCVRWEFANPLLSLHPLRLLSCVNKDQCWPARYHQHSLDTCWCVFFLWTNVTAQHWYPCSLQQRNVGRIELSGLVGRGRLTGGLTSLLQHGIPPIPTTLLPNAHNTFQGHVSYCNTQPRVLFRGILQCDHSCAGCEAEVEICVGSHWEAACNLTNWLNNPLPVSFLQSI